MIAVLVMILCVGVILAGLMLYGKHQQGKIPAMSFQEVLEYTTGNCGRAVITVGVIKDGQASYTVYGENGKELPKELHTYEIGSITKTFTAALVNQAIQEGKIELNATIDQYLDLPQGLSYPTITELLTHTSGYKGYYFESPMITNFLKGRNDFYGITKEQVLKKAGTLDMKKESYGFTYSNYGFAVLGLVLESVYDTDYTTLLNQFAQNDLGLLHTKISDQSGDLGRYWDWKEHDAYISAGAITSDIEDMLAYAQMQLAETPYFATCHQSLKTANASPEAYQAMGIRLDEIGMSWIIDNENGIIWHNGGTGDYNSYLGFDPGTGTAVVVLSNLSPLYRIPATVLGVKLMAELKG